MNEDKLPVDRDQPTLRDRLSKETAKLIKIKIENDLKEKEQQDTIKDLKVVVDNQRKNIIIMQMDLEKNSELMTQEIKLRESVLTKVANTRQWCIELENRFKSITEYFENCKKSYSDVKAAFDNINKTVAALRKHFETNEQVLNEKIQTLEKKLFEEAKDKKEAADALAEKTAELIKTELLFNAEQDKNLTLKKEISERSKECSILKSESNKAIDEYKKQIYNLNEQIYQVKKDHQAMQEAFNKENLDLSNNVLKYQNQVNSLETQKKDLENLIASQNEILDEKSAKADEQDRKLSTLEHQNTCLENKILALQREITSHLDEIQSLTATNNELQSIISNKDNQLNDSNDKIGELLDKNVDLTNAHISIERQLKNTLDEKIINEDRFNNEKTDLIAELDSVKELVDEQKRKNEELQELLKTKDGESNDITKELNDLKANHQLLIDEKEKEIRQLNMQVELKAEVINNLMMDINKSKCEIEELQQTHQKNIKNKDLIINSMKKNAKDHETALKKLKDENAELKEKIYSVKSSESPKPPDEIECTSSNKSTSNKVVKITPVSLPKTGPAKKKDNFGWDTGCDSSSDDVTFDPKDVNLRYEQYIKGEKILPPPRRIFKSRNTPSSSQVDKKKKGI